MENYIEIEDLAGDKGVKTFKVKKEVEIPYSSHSIEKKSRIFLDLGSIHTSLISREINSVSKPVINNLIDHPEFKSMVEAYIFVWDKLKKIGLPVVPNVRKLDDKHIVQTDLIASGYSVYDVKIDIHTDREKQASDHQLKLIPQDEIRQRATEIAKLASTNGVRLAYDGPFHLIVNSKGEWDLIMLDLGNVSIGNEEKDLNDFNQERVDIFVDSIGKIKATIQI